MKGAWGVLILLILLCLLVTIDWVDHSSDHNCYCTTDSHCQQLHGLPPMEGHILRGESQP